MLSFTSKYFQDNKREIITPKMAWFRIHEVCYSKKEKNAPKMNHLDANEMQFFLFILGCFSISVCKRATTYFSVGGDRFHIPTRHILYLNVNLYSRFKRPIIWWSEVLYYQTMFDLYVSFRVKSMIWMNTSYIIFRVLIILW